MHVVELRLHNWARFRGEHAVQLAPGVYGVVARKASNPLASNWSGKTWLLSAVRFALYGRHDAATEDGWITRGEREGGVGLLLSDGTAIERRRGTSTSSPVWWCSDKLKGRDAATRLSVRGNDGIRYYDDVAQRYVERLLGLDRQDFDATCWVEQKQACRFVTSTPAERMAVIGGWLRLEKLQAADKIIAGRLARLFDSEQRTMQTAAGACAELRRILGAYLEDVSGEETKQEVLDELQAIAAQLDDKLQTARTRTEQLRTQLAELGAWQRNVQRVQVIAQLTDARALHSDEALRARVVSAGDAVKHAVAAYEQEVQTAGQCAAAHRQARTLASGRFTGLCPLDGHDCPDRDAMNAAADANRRTCDAARASYDAAEQCKNVKRLELDEAREALRLAKQAVADRERLIELAHDAKRDAERIARDGLPPSDAELLERARQAEQDCLLADRELLDCRNAMAGVEHNASARDKANAYLAEIRRDLKVQQAAQLIVGRQGAQRRIAEHAVNAITAVANDALTEAGIDLRVAVRWARETKDLAEVCSRCGAAFPRGRSVKQCARCGAERGPKLSEKVEVELSETSGAAEDIAGMALQLAASTWLRQMRGCNWSMVLLDEPLAACDRVNRKAMAAHVVALLRGRYGFEQAMMTAHTSDAMDAMPQRIEIVANDDGSTVKVL